MVEIMCNLAQLLGQIRMKTTENSDIAGSAKKDVAWLETVRRQVESLRYGAVQIVVHEARVVQIEKTEKIRFDKPAAD
jgi:hypothetical protein